MTSPLVPTFKTAWNSSNEFKIAFIILLIIVYYFAYTKGKADAKASNSFYTRDVGVHPKWWGGNLDTGTMINNPTTTRHMKPFMYGTDGHGQSHGQSHGHNGKDKYCNAAPDQWTAAGPCVINPCNVVDCSRTDPKYWDKAAIEEMQVLARLEAVDMRDRDLVARTEVGDSAFGKKGSIKPVYNANSP